MIFIQAFPMGGHIDDSVGKLPSTKAMRVLLVSTVPVCVTSDLMPY
jgi:hypothetical protein